MVAGLAEVNVPDEVMTGVEVGNCDYCTPHQNIDLCYRSLAPGQKSPFRLQSCTILLNDNSLHQIPVSQTCRKQGFVFSDRITTCA